MKQKIFISILVVLLCSFVNICNMPQKKSSNNNSNYPSWRSICKIKLLVKAAWRWYHFHRQLSGLSPCLKFVIGRALTILSWDNPVTAFFRKLRHSLGRPSRSDFVQFEVAELITLPFEEKTVILYRNKKNKHYPLIQI